MGSCKDICGGTSSTNMPRERAVVRLCSKPTRGQYAAQYESPPYKQCAKSKRDRAGLWRTARAETWSLPVSNLELEALRGLQQ